MVSLIQDKVAADLRHWSSKANSTAAGVVGDEAAVAVVMFLPYYYRRNNVAPRIFDPSPGSEYPAGSLRAALP